jgi:hypothetical protein
VHTQDYGARPDGDRRLVAPAEVLGGVAIVAEPGALRPRLEVVPAERSGLGHATLQVEHSLGPVELGRSVRPRTPLGRG